MVNTMGKKYQGFTSYEINRYNAVYKSLGRLGDPTVGDFEKNVRTNQIQNCPITSKDMTNEKVIVGLKLAWERGKTVKNTPKRVDSDCLEIPRDFQFLHKSVTFVANVFFVNRILFFEYAKQETFFFGDCQTHMIQES